MSHSCSARQQLGTLLLLLVAFCLASSHGDAAPSCGGATPVTPLGDHYKANAPLRTALPEAGTAGTRIVLSGRVLDHNCRSALGALLDFWHADDAGRYDSRGFELRGRQTTDTQGRYRLETILPGVEAGRARAIHVKLAAQGGRVMTTRLYFPDEPTNADDASFRGELLMKIERGREGLFATFDFVLPPP